MKKLGESCEHNKDCEAAVRHSFCDYDTNICMCRGGEKVYEYKGVKYCYRRSAGEQCEEDDDCLSKFFSI